MRRPRADELVPHRSSLSRGFQRGHASLSFLHEARRHVIPSTRPSPQAPSRRASAPHASRSGSLFAIVGRTSFPFRDRAPELPRAASRSGAPPRRGRRDPAPLPRPARRRRRDGPPGFTFPRSRNVALDRVGDAVQRRKLAKLGVVVQRHDEVGAELRLLCVDRTPAQTLPSRLRQTAALPTLPAAPVQRAPRPLRAASPPHRRAGRR